MSSLIVSALLILSAAAGEPATQPASADEHAVREAFAAYVEAYNHGDTKSLAQCFAEDARYIPAAGDLLRGRQAIRDELAKMFQDPKAMPHLAVQVSSVELPRRNMAIVHGTSTVTLSGGEPSSTEFRAVFVRLKDKWLIKSSEDLDKGGEALEQLNWLLGSWVDEDEKASIQTNFSRSSDGHFITRSFTASFKNGPELRGTEVIGWDPAARVLRSWVFDSDGSFGQSIWTHRKDEWIAKSRGVLPDGSRASAVHIYHQIDPDRYTWESVDREVDGEIMPNIGPVMNVRSQTQPADNAAERQP